MIKKIILIFLFAWSFLTLFSSGIVESQDGLQYLTIARQLYYHQTFAMPAAKYPLNNIHMNVEVGREGKDFSPTGLGFSLAYVPAVFFEDIINRTANVTPSENFPLNADWPIMLFGSMTNAVFGALFIVTFFLFLKTFKFSDTSALVFSFILFISSNLFVYTKHGFAHMMFVSFMWLSFFFIRKYRLHQQLRYVIGAALAYGVVLVSYNPTYLLPLPAIALYYLTSIDWKNRSKVIKIVSRDIITAVISLLPFFLIYSWFNWVRFGGAVSTGYGTGAIALPPVPPAFVFYEGLWGLLFSPGKSIFIFTPALILLLLFWFKFKKQYLPEMVASVTLFGVYVLFIASLVGSSDFFPWHGEASFGPRYLVPVLPFALLLIALLYRELSSKQRLWVFWPIISLGILIQMVGILIPYQVRFSGIEYQYVLSGHRITSDVYGNFIPRFSPPYSMTKWLLKKIAAIPAYYFSNPEIIAIDGVHGILETPEGGVRQLEPLAAFSFNDDVVSKPVSLSFYNYVATVSAVRDLHVEVAQDERTLGVVTVATSSASQIDISPNTLTKNAPFILKYSYVGTPSAKLSDQVPFISGISVAGEPVSLDGFHYPYVSQVSKALFGQKYYYWGGQNQDLWDQWNMRSINYVHTLDLWWLRPLHYWDLPKSFFAILFIGNATICIASGLYLRKLIDNTIKRKRTA